MAVERLERELHPGEERVPRRGVVGDLLARATSRTRPASPSSARTRPPARAPGGCAGARTPRTPASSAVIFWMVAASRALAPLAARPRPGPGRRRSTRGSSWTSGLPRVEQLESGGGRAAGRGRRNLSPKVTNKRGLEVCRKGARMRQMKAFSWIPWVAAAVFLRRPDPPWERTGPRRPRCACRRRPRRPGTPWISRSIPARTPSRERSTSTSRSRKRPACCG